VSDAQIAIFCVLGFALVLFAWGRFRHDQVAVAALLAAVVLGVVPHREAFLGFGHPAVITVAAVLMISQALKNAGVVTLVAERLRAFTTTPLLHIAVLTLVVTVASAFMNNVGALALMLPVALATAAEQNRSPALLLMPLAFGSILGGMTTMIGTPPNIIIASYREEITGSGFAMFDFSPVGVAVAAAGVVFMTFIGWRLIPGERLQRNAPQQLFDTAAYLLEVRIGETSSLVDRPLHEFEELHGADLEIVGVARNRAQAIGPPVDHPLRAGEVLVLRGNPEKLRPLFEEAGLELVTSATRWTAPGEDADLLLLEAVVSTQSPLLQRDVAYLRRRVGGSAALIGLAREGRQPRERLRRQRFRAGDVLLLQVQSDAVGQVLETLALLPLAQRDLLLDRPRRLWLSLAVFAAAIVVGAAGWLPIGLCFLAALAVYVLLDVLPLRDIYNSVDWPVIVLLGALIPVGRALESTGATGLIAQTIVTATGDLSPLAVLALLLIATMFLSDIISNAATALIMAPIAVSVALTLNADSDAFLMAVAIGASCAFLTPIGHQSNTLVMGPAGYRFGDYWRVGLPLEVLIVLIAVPLLAVFWPL
jgi:di/tricarboxylate transporter